MTQSPIFASLDAHYKGYDVKKATTLFEMILVLVVVGIMLSVGAMVLRPHHLRDDAHFVLLKIREAQYRGIGYDHRDFGGGTIAIGDSIGCLTLSKAALDENATQGKGYSYAIGSEFSGYLADKELCFDHEGRPALGGYSPILAEKKVLILTNSNKEVNLTLYPYSGYVTITY